MVTSAPTDGVACVMAAGAERTVSPGGATCGRRDHEQTDDRDRADRHRRPACCGQAAPATPGSQAARYRLGACLVGAQGFSSARLRVGAGASGRPCTDLTAIPAAGGRAVGTACRGRQTPGCPGLRGRMAGRAARRRSTRREGDGPPWLVNGTFVLADGTSGPSLARWQARTVEVQPSFWQ
jgi:hypothetical protein